MAWPAPSHYLNQCWNIVNWTLRNKLQWNFNRNSNMFIQENAHENVVCEMASILCRPQCVNTLQKTNYTGVRSQISNWVYCVSLGDVSWFKSNLLLLISIWKYPFGNKNLMLTDRWFVFPRPDMNIEESVVSMINIEIHWVRQYLVNVV